ncbi:hypothetical protein [Anaerophaga thermohalophila]|nr:hypothetical protein [Anaerophaga thermohalophila]
MRKWLSFSAGSQAQVFEQKLIQLEVPLQIPASRQKSTTNVL